MLAETYQDSQGYKDYLKLPKSYQSPQAEQLYKQGYEARRTVENLPCKNGGTIKSCLDAKVSIKVVDDLGWNVTPYRDGYYVERKMILNNLQLSYRWQVSSTGTVSAENGHAIGLMDNQ